MRRRVSPYDQSELIAHVREQIIVLVLITVILGTLLGLATGSLYDWLNLGLVPGRVFVVSMALSLVFVAFVWVIVYGRGHRLRVPMDIHIPYVIARSTADIVIQPACHVTRDAQRAFRHRYRRRSPAETELCEAWIRARGKGEWFHYFIRESHAGLLQWLVLFEIHKHGRRSLGSHSWYGWWRTPLPKQELTVKDLPKVLQNDPYLVANTGGGQWKLLLPRDVQLCVLPPGQSLFRWRLTMRCYGNVDLTVHCPLSMAGRDSQVHKILTWRRPASVSRQVYTVGARLEVVAHFRRPFLPGADAYHAWAADLLSHLEEAQDWGYFLTARSDRILGDLEWKMGWVPEGDSIVGILQDIQARLDRLEVAAGGGVHGIASPDTTGEQT